MLTPGGSSRFLTPVRLFSWPFVDYQARQTHLINQTRLPLLHDDPGRIGGLKEHHYRQGADRHVFPFTLQPRGINSSP